MTRSQLIQNCKTELTGGGAYPMYIMPPEIDRVINESIAFFNQNVQDSVSRTQFVVKKEIFECPEFKKNKKLVLPDSVQSVDGVKELRGYSSFIGPDISPERLMASELFLMSVNNQFDMVMLAASQSYYDLSKAFMLDQIAYEFNINTKELTITGRQPYYDVLLSTWSSIADEKLFDNYWFRRYVSCMLMKSQCNFLGRYADGPNLPNGQRMNIDRMQQNANDELEKIIEKLQALDPPDWFILSN